MALALLRLLLLQLSGCSPSHPAHHAGSNAWLGLGPGASSALHSRMLNVTFTRYTCASNQERQAVPLKTPCCESEGGARSATTCLVFLRAEQLVAVDCDSRLLLRATDAELCYRKQCIGYQQCIGYSRLHGDDDDYYTTHLWRAQGAFIITQLTQWVDHALEKLALLICRDEKTDMHGMNMHRLTEVSPAWRLYTTRQRLQPSELPRCCGILCRLHCVPAQRVCLQLLCCVRLHGTDRLRLLCNCNYPIPATHLSPEPRPLHHSSRPALAQDILLRHCLGPTCESHPCSWRLEAASPRQTVNPAAAHFQGSLLHSPLGAAPETSLCAPRTTSTTAVWLVPVAGRRRRCSHSRPG